MNERNKPKSKVTLESNQGSERLNKDRGSQLNKRENETEPLDNDQKNTTGADYATRDSSTIGMGGPGVVEEEQSPSDVSDNADKNSFKLRRESFSSEKKDAINSKTQAPDNEDRSKKTSQVYGEGAVRKDDSTAK